MAVGAGFGFGGEGEACWQSAMPPVEIKVRIISRTIRIIECEMERSAPHLLRGFIDLGEVLISQIGVPTNGRNSFDSDLALTHKRRSPSGFKHLLWIQVAVELDELPNQARPTGLMAGPYACSVISVEVLVEK